MTQPIEMEYVSKSFTVKDIESKTHELMDELRRGGELREKADKLGIDVNSLLNRSNDELIKVKPAKAGFSLTGIAIVFAPLAVEITRDLWKEILLPKLRQHFGADALKEKEEVENA